MTTEEKDFIVGHSRCNPFLSLSLAFSPSLFLCFFLLCHFPFLSSFSHQPTKTPCREFSSAPFAKRKPGGKFLFQLVRCVLASYRLLARISFDYQDHPYRLSQAVGSIVFSALSINVLIDFGPSVGERDPPS